MKKDELCIRDWSKFNAVVPQSYRSLLLALANKATPYDERSPDTSQIVYIGPVAKAIMAECGWKTRDPLAKGLKSLCECNALRREARGVYRVNPDIVVRYR